MKAYGILIIQLAFALVAQSVWADDSLGVYFPGETPGHSVLSLQSFLVTPEHIGDALAIVQREWPHDYERYAEKFRVVRDACDLAAKPIVPARKGPKLEVASIMSYRQAIYLKNARKYQHENLKKQVEMLRGAFLLESQLSRCPQVPGFPQFSKDMGRSLLTGYLDRLISDIDSGHYAQCRQDIDDAIGPPPPRTEAKAAVVKRAKK